MLLAGPGRRRRYRSSAKVGTCSTSTSGDWTGESGSRLRLECVQGQTNKPPGGRAAASEGSSAALR